MKIADSARLVPGFIPMSKVMAKYAKENGLSKTAVRKEFERKAGVIRAATESSNGESAFTESILRGWYP